jgi:hypothetical protein
VAERAISPARAVLGVALVGLMTSLTAGSIWTASSGASGIARVTALSIDGAADGLGRSQAGPKTLVVEPVSGRRRIQLSGVGPMRDGGGVRGVAPSLERSYGAGSVTRPVTRCPTTDAVGARIRRGPARVELSASRAVARRVVGYDAGGLVLLGPSRWRCSSFIYGNGSQTIAVSPPGQRGASFGTSSDPWPRPLAIAVTHVPACAGCRADLACPFFPAEAAKLGQPCASGVPRGEKVTRLSRDAVLFEDPPRVSGSTSYSGGTLRVFGVVVAVGDSQRRAGYALKATCALREADRELCTTTLRWLAERRL